MLTKGVRLRYFKDILTKFKGLKPKERQFIDNAIVVCKLIHVNPATSKTGEWSFSTARLIKTGRSIKNAASTFKPSCNFGHTQKEITQAMFSFCG